MSGRRNRGGGGGHGGGGEERWLLPYADMITLLLGLFIVLFAMSTLDAKKFENVKRELSQVFTGQVTTEPGSILDGSESVLDPTNTTEVPSQATVQQARDTIKHSQKQFKEQAEQLTQVVKSAGLKQDVKVIPDQRGIIIRLAGDALFDSGQSTLKPEVKDKLARIEKQLQKFDRKIEIVGHTDGAPYPYAGGNWALGADRAQAVLMFFRERDYPEMMMRFASEGPTHPLVAPPKNHPEKSIAANRRIEILVLAPGANVPGTPTEKLVNTASALDSPAISNPAGLDLFGELAATAKANGR